MTAEQERLLSRLLGAQSRREAYNRLAALRAAGWRGACSFSGIDAQDFRVQVFPIEQPWGAPVPTFNPRWRPGLPWIWQWLAPPRARAAEEVGT